METFEDDQLAFIDQLGAPELPDERNQKIEVKPQRIEDRLKWNGNSPSQFHTDLLSKLINRRNMGHEAIKARYERWDDVDDFLRMRLDLDKPARLADGSTDMTKKEYPFERTVVIPISFAMMQTRLVQKMGILLGRNPILQVTGASPDDVLGARLMSSALAFDTRKSNAALAFHQAVWDTERYNLSVLYDTWEVENGIVLRPPPMFGTPMYDMAKKTMGKVFPQMFEWKRDWGKRAEYNNLKPVDIRRFYPDPRVPFARCQEGEFIGHGTLLGYMYIKERSQENDGPYFNVDEVKKFCGYGADAATAGAKRWYTPGTNYKADEFDRGVYCVDHMQVKLIPSEWKLGDSDKPEIWWFTWVDDAVIIRAHASEYEHDKFTYSVSEAILDYHSTDNPGYGENMIGIQTLIDWLFGSHIENTRRIINASFIYPPTLIEEADLTNPIPAGHIRLTQRGEELLMSGRITPAQIVQQLQVQSPTVAHLQTINILSEQAMRMFAANDPVQGMQMQSERTLGEIQTIMAAASNRVAHDMRVMDMMAIQPLVERMVSNRRQFTTEEEWYQVVGDAANSILELAKRGNVQKTIDGIRALIGQADLQGQYDYIPLTPLTGSDPAKKAETWQQAMMAIAQMQQSGGFNPELYPDGRVPDFRAILNEMLRNLGIHNVEQYYVEMESAKLQSVQADFQRYQGVANLAMQASQFNQQAQQMGFPPWDINKIQPLIQVVPDEQYQKGVESGQYVTPEQMSPGA